MAGLAVERGLLCSAFRAGDTSTRERDYECILETTNTFATIFYAARPGRSTRSVSCRPAAMSFSPCGVG